MTDKVRSVEKLFNDVVWGTNTGDEYSRGGAEPDEEKAHAILTADRLALTRAVIEECAKVATRSAITL